MGERKPDPKEVERWEIEPGDAPAQVGDETAEWVIPGAKPKTEKPGQPDADSLRRRIAELEETLAGERARAEAAEQRAAAAEKRVGSAGRNATGETRDRRALAKPVDKDRGNINALGYQDLREMGLDVKESSRLLAIRDLRGGFRSIDELDEIRDLPASLMVELKARLST